MTEIELNALIKAAYTDRKALHELQTVTREQTEAIVRELRGRGMSEYNTGEHKAAIRTKSQKRFDMKGAAAANEAFVTAHTVVKTYESVQIL